MAAIQICLGANARQTHRARSLKDLVRRDAAHTPTGAKIRVTLHNRGSDAYQHEIYGDTITVERNISIRVGGDNGYKLLDQDNVVRSKLKKDLDDMLDTLYVTVFLSFTIHEEDVDDWNLSLFSESTTPLVRWIVRSSTLTEFFFSLFIYGTITGIYKLTTRSRYWIKNKPKSF